MRSRPVDPVLPEAVGHYGNDCEGERHCTSFRVGERHAGSRRPVPLLAVRTLGDYCQRTQYVTGFEVATCVLHLFLCHFFMKLCSGEYIANLLFNNRMAQSRCRSGSGFMVDYRCENPEQ